jgi:hypothetical protein
MTSKEMHFFCNYHATLLGGSREMLDFAMLDSVWFKVGMVAVAYLVIQRFASRHKKTDDHNC